MFSLCQSCTETSINSVLLRCQSVEFSMKFVVLLKEWMFGLMVSANFVSFLGSGSTCAIWNRISTGPNTGRSGRSLNGILKTDIFLCSVLYINLLIIFIRE